MKVQTNNQYGEKENLEINGTNATSFSDQLPPKTDVAALTAIATADAPAAAADYAQADIQAMVTLINGCKAKINSIIAALKDVP